MTIYFYNPKEQPYGCFSNFARFGFHLDGKDWPTSEHYFQAQKFAGTPHMGDVLRAPTPRAAAAIGRDRQRPLRQDWEAVKDDVMRAAVRAKFTQNPALREVLLSTGEAPLIEAAPKDYYWGCGADGSGQNRLGEILMEIRAELRQTVATRDRWKTEPLPEKRVPITIDRTFSHEAYLRISQGVVPTEMEEKWFIFLEDDWLYLHRSWTGICIFKLKLQPSGPAWRVAEAWANADPEQYTETDPEQMVKTALNVIHMHFLSSDI